MQAPVFAQLSQRDMPSEVNKYSVEQLQAMIQAKLLQNGSNEANETRSAQKIELGVKNIQLHVEHDHAAAAASTVCASPSACSEESAVHRYSSTRSPLTPSAPNSPTFDFRSHLSVDPNCGPKLGAPPSSITFSHSAPNSPVGPASSSFGAASGDRFQSPMPTTPLSYEYAKQHRYQQGFVHALNQTGGSGTIRSDLGTPFMPIAEQAAQVKLQHEVEILRTEVAALRASLTDTENIKSFVEHDLKMEQKIRSDLEKELNACYSRLKEQGQECITAKEKEFVSCFILFIFFFSSFGVCVFIPLFVHIVCV